MININSILGQKITIEYFDQNDDFKKILPRSGVILKQYTISKDDWFLIKLDQSFNYEGEKNTHLLIKSRWQNQIIKDKKPTSVFVLLVSDFQYLDSGQNLDLDKFKHVCWGMAK